MPNEGDEAVNHQTGETAVFKNGEWAVSPPSWGDTLTKDVPRAAASGLINRAVPGVLGSAGDAESLGSWLGEKLMTGIFGYPPKTEEEKAKLREPILGPKERQNPTSEEIKQRIDAVVPPHQAATETGRMTENVAAFLPAAMLGGPRAALKSAVIPGVASQGAADAAKWLGANETGQNAAYLTGALANPTAAIRGQAFNSFMTPKGIAQAKDLVGRTTGGVLATQIARELGWGNEPAFTYTFGHTMTPEFLKKIPGDMVFGGGKFQPGDAAAIVRALQETGARSGSPPVQ